MVLFVLRTVFLITFGSSNNGSGSHIDFFWQKSSVELIIMRFDKIETNTQWMVSALPEYADVDWGSQ